MMKMLFSPAIALLNRAGFRSKFVLIFLCVMLPLLFLSSIVLDIINSEISMLSNERDGVLYLSAARTPLDLIQQHRGLMATAVRTGDPDTHSRAAALRPRIQSSLTNLASLTSDTTGSPQIQRLMQSIQQQWASLSSNPSGLNASASFEAHTNLISLFTELMHRASDHFELSLSSHLDSYYLADALSLRLPQLTETMGQARAHASSAAAEGLLDNEQRIALEILLFNMAAALAGLEDGLDSASAANSALSQSLSGARTRNREAISQLSGQLRSQILQPEFITVSGTEIFDTASNSINSSYALFDAIHPLLEQLLQDRLRIAERSRALDISLVAGILLVLGYLFTCLYMAINKSVAQIADAANSVSSGELSVRVQVDADDELRLVGDSFNKITSQFEQLIVKVTNATTQLASAAEELSSVSRHSAQNVLKQRSETDMVAVSINEMNATVNEVSQSTMRASTAANDTNDQAVHGAELVNRAAVAIRALSTDINDTAEGMQRVAGDSQSISSVLDVIMSIAEQTNLLALNAAIEAARAGEHGRGFAVVADEVRTLANRTKDSASEIDGMIRNLQNGVRDAVTLMESSRGKAGEGVALAAEATQSLDSITQAVTTISDMNLQIASAAEQQTATTEELNRNVTSIRELAEQSAAGAAQTTVASDELAKLASDLQASISWFKVSN
ncbi:MAG: methyl-accepting chemotaxis protein [Pseudohongiella sp.]|nr:methyl-accepting chemotaxis protein [Pseudohongiella sp.]